MQYDIIIVGGGLVGASLAASLASLPLKIAIIEASTSNQDARVIALNYVSARIFEAIGLWPQMQHTAIKHIHISDRGHWGMLRLSHTDLNLPALGYVLTAQNIGQALQTKLQAVDFIAPATAQYLGLEDSQITIQSQTQKLSAKLLIVADGANSQLCQQLNIPIQQHDYGQTAIISNLTLDRPHLSIAYERFTTHGPIALLPMLEQQSALVWSLPPERAQSVLQLSEQEFLLAIQQEFGWRAGRFIAATARLAYPLRRTMASSVIAPRVVIMGNAAHTLHPVAGQGFNLALRGVANLAEVLVTAWEHGEYDIGSDDLLQNYLNYQADDQLLMLNLTHNIVNLFSNQWLPAVLARNCGLGLMETISPVKYYLMQQMLGLKSYPSRLARGVAPVVAPTRSQ
jgi:2-octaprenyl-6-methoxyphenol hydroxylase